jgi:hypothetical protein
MPIKIEAEDAQSLHFTLTLGEVRVGGVMTPGAIDGCVLAINPGWRGVVVEAPLTCLRAPGQRQSVAQAYQLIERVTAVLLDETPSVVMCREELITTLFSRAGLVPARRGE